MLTKEYIQEEFNFIYDGKFMVQGINEKYCEFLKSNIIFINVKCNDCEHEWTSELKQFTKRKNHCVGCAGWVWTLKRAKEHSKQVHEDRFIIYDYFILRNKYTSIGYLNIKCKVCNTLAKVIAKEHLTEGHGCNDPFCRSQARMTGEIKCLENNPNLANEKCKLYFLKFTHRVTYEEFYKVGKTKQSIDYRFSKEKKVYDIEVMKIIESTHLWAAQEEREFIDIYRDYQYIPNDKFGGYTECFKF